MKKVVQGFSIVELLIYCGLLSIILVIIAQLFTSILNLQLDTESSSSLSSDGQYLLSRFTYDLRRATTVSNPTLGSTGSSLSFTTNGQAYSYGLVGENLVSTPGGQLNSAQTTVENLRFTHLGAVGAVEHTVKIEFNLGSKIDEMSGIETRSFSTTVGLRPN